MSTFGVHYSDYYRNGSGERYFQLTHQCDEWEIGTVEDMRAFIAECQSVLDAVESGNVDDNGNYLPDDLDEY